MTEPLSGQSERLVIHQCPDCGSVLGPDDRVDLVSDPDFGQYGHYHDDEVDRWVVGAPVRVVRLEDVRSLLDHAYHPQLNPSSPVPHPVDLLDKTFGADE